VLLILSQALVALRLYKSMAREAEDLEVDVASEVTCYAQ